MATAPRSLRRLAVGAASTVLLGLPVATTGVAHAAPAASAAQVQARLKSMIHQVETVTEKYNAATVDLTKKRATAATAAARARTLDGTLSAAKGKVRTMVSATYRAVPFSDFTTFMTSSSPQEFLDQLSALDILAKRRSAAVSAVQEAKVQVDQATQQAQQAAAAANSLVTSLARQKSTLDGQITQQKALLSQLTVSQRREVLGSDDLVAPNVPASGRAQAAVAAARSVLGTPYVTAGASPNPGFDCSGLTMWAWAHAGVSLPHHAASQYGMGPHVPRDQLQPGDLVFFYSPISHVGIYVGNGLMIHAPTTGDVVKVSPISEFPYAGATRVG